MLASVRVTGCLPRLEEETLAWLPVDLAARAVLEVGGRFGGAGRTSGGEEAEVPVFHLLNPDRETSWGDLLGWMGKLEPRAFEVVTAREWVERLEGLQFID